MTIYWLEFLNDPDSLYYKMYWGTNTFLRVCNFHSITKPLKHLMKCLTIKLLFTSQEIFLKKLENQDILSMYKKNSVSDSISQYHTLFQNEMAWRAFGKTFWILLYLSVRKRSVSPNNPCIMIYPPFCIPINHIFPHSLQWEILYLLISLVLIELMPVMWKVL